MIGKHDFVRTSVELIHFPGDASVWCERQGIDPDALMDFMSGFARALASSPLKDEHDEETEALAAFCSAFSIGFELGRQYPSTPFEP